jgi:all-trans-retinol dehydrogenase (NAD+)
VIVNDVKIEVLNMSNFQNSNVLITGAASGIGKLMAQKAAERGANLILWDIDAEGLHNFAETLKQKNVTVHTFVCDLSDKTAIQETAEKVKQTCGGVDILINNAGIISGKYLVDIPDESIIRTFQVNTLALFWTTKAFLPDMLKRKKGHIVTIASAGGLIGTAKMVDYCSSKFAAVGFDDSLRLELKRLNSPVKTTVVCPFYINTGMFEGVKTRFPLLLPILEPEYVANKVIRSIEKNYRRVIMPRFVYAGLMLRFLPIPIFDAIIGFFGITKSMDEFVGRQKKSVATEKDAVPH